MAINPMREVLLIVHNSGYEFKVVSVLDGIPGQLSKHEKKFTLSSISKNARMRTYEEAFFWLSDARIANICYASTDPSVGLGLSMGQTSLKCYMADTGLLATLALSTGSASEEDVYRAVLRGDVGLNEGMLVENVVAQSLVANGHKLFFYSQSGKKEHRQRMEIDFLIVRPYANAAGKPRVSPIEVKSPRQYGTTSLDRFKETFGKKIGTQYVLHPKQMKTDGDRAYLPLYMAGLPQGKVSNHENARTSHRQRTTCSMQHPPVRTSRSGAAETGSSTYFNPPSHLLAAKKFGNAFELHLFERLMLARKRFRARSCRL